MVIKMEIKIAKTFKQKLIGLMGQTKIEYGLLLLNTTSIHTFFMKEPIDIILLNNNMEVIDKRYNIGPNKIVICKNANHILELPKFASKKYKIGQIITVNLK